MYRNGRAPFSGIAASVLGTLGSAAVEARSHAVRFFATKGSGDVSREETSDHGATGASGITEEPRNEFANMDMSTHNFTVGKFKGVEAAATAQMENVKPIPKAASGSAHHADAGCCGQGHHSTSAGGVHEPVGNVDVAPSSSFGRIFKEEAAAMISERKHRSLESTPVQHSPPGSGSARPSVPPEWMSEEEMHALLKQREAAEEMQRFLAQNTLRSIQRSAERDISDRVGGNFTKSVASPVGPGGYVHGADARLPPGRRGVQALLDYNKQWAAEVSRFNPRYFQELAREQKPEYLWIGCSDSRVPANEVIGLHPGDVFVHRNIGNIFSLSDLNCLSTLQFAVDCLKVQHVIIAGHYKCGGVTAAMNGTSLGLTDHWIMQVTDIKNKFWDRVTLEIPEADHLNVLCELNVLQQLSHAVNCRIVQRLWKAQNHEDRFIRERNQHIYVRAQYAQAHPLRPHNNVTDAHPGGRDEVECHGWVYSLDDGMLRPLLSLTRLSDIKKQIEDATEAVFVRYSSR